MATAIYLRVSSNPQDTRSQEADLKAWAAQQAEKGEAVAWYRDKASGTNYDRADWQRLEADLNTGRVSRLVVWRLVSSSGPVTTALPRGPVPGCPLPMLSV